MRQQVSFDFPADVKHVLDVREAVHKISLDMGFSPHETSLIITAVWEATLNAATHGSPNGNSDQVKVNILAEDGLLTVEITSSNPEFRLPKDKPVFSPSSRRGRGLPIIFAFMDRVWLTRSDDGVTLHMSKRLPEASNHRSGSRSAAVPAPAEAG